ncbi:Serpentine receptor class r-10 [Caenorhabditis elegans]|uniref:Serpentine receptor class r-10 n=1 Tax=Caenorhabditis elegans TaxID=6239 RepID=Q9N482_CAEEL|nr:Seven TM Receptor [Caenorhabditis elegans]CCD72232.1 Seven TM Receptor [Caenorhabditis elegans]|eukprot:NP_500660.2 Seven TM Receptor [Caenorhabditis elegans]
MHATTFESIKFVFQVTSVIFSWLINSFLIYLILTKSTSKMGNYRHLMIYFCCFSILFSTLDIIVQPNIHTYKSAFFMIMDYKNRGIPLWMAEVLICLMCGCFGMTIYGIAVHFIYRLFALERKGRLQFFQEKYLFFWLLIPFIGGAAWFSACFTVFSMDPMKTDYVRQTTKEFFDLNIDNCVYAGAAFYPLDKNGTTVISTRSFIGFSLFLVVMLIPFAIVIYAGIKSYFIIRALLKQGETRYAKNLQMQLYKALVAQTLISIFFLFIPFGTIFVLPIFEINCQFLTAPITFIYALYPAIDPLPILFFVDYYRIVVSNLFNRIRCKNSRVGIYEEEPASSNNGRT